MPHCLIEYSDNVGAAADTRGLLAKVADKYRNSTGVFPTIGIRVRAIEINDYVVADGDPENAFVHATCVVAPGRPEAVLGHFFNEMFEMMKQHLAPAARDRFLGLSLDVVEGNEGRSYKHNFG